MILNLFLGNSFSKSPKEAYLMAIWSAAGVPTHEFPLQKKLQFFLKYVYLNVTYIQNPKNFIPVCWIILKVLSYIVF